MKYLIQIHVFDDSRSYLLTEKSTAAPRTTLDMLATVDAEEVLR
jgi:hypothetical protein